MWTKRSQSLRKSGQFCRDCQWITPGICQSGSQSLRKSGQFCLKVGNLEAHFPF